jgi:hypothetical protein
MTHRLVIPGVGANDGAEPLARTKAWLNAIVNDRYLEQVASGASLEPSPLVCAPTLDHAQAAFAYHRPTLPMQCPCRRQELETPPQRRAT